MLNFSEVNSILITGANGFVGRSLIDEFARLPIEKLPSKLILLTRRGLDFELPPQLKKISNVHTVDLTKPWSVDHRVSHVVNLAADGSHSAYSAEANSRFEYIVHNLISWLSILDVKPRIFHASTGACFGYKPLEPRLNHINPKMEFARSRELAEKRLVDASDTMGFELSIGRLFTFSGTHLLKKPQYAISNFVISAVRNGIVDVKGDPNSVRSYLHQDAMAKWILASLISPTQFLDLQIGSNDAVTLGTLATFIADVTGSSINFSPNPPPGDIYLPENESTQVRLRVEEGVGWKIAVQKMIEEMRASDGNF